MTLAASPPLRHLCSDRNKAFAAIGETIVVKTRGADMDHVDIIDAVYQAAVHSEQWPDTLCSIVDYVGAVAGNIVYQAPGGRGSFLIPGRMREDLNTLYLQHYTGNPYARAFEKVRPGEIAIGNSLIDAEAVRHSAFYADICEPQNIFNQLFLPHASLHERGGIGGVALFLSRQQHEHAAEAAARLKLLSPHMARAIDLSFQINKINRAPELPQRLIDAIPDAAVLIDGRGAVLLLNAAAETLFRQADGIFLSRSERPALAAHISETATRLANAIRQALLIAHGEDTPFEGALAISRPSGLPPYLMMITPLAPTAISTWDATDSGARVLIHIVDPEAKTRRQAQQLQHIFGLTDAETRVAALIGSGMNLPEIALALGISSNTVKTHAGRCFGKAGVRSQAALARLIASIPIAEKRAPTPTGSHGRSSPRAP
ncbi:helix-turn-helix transcriptional regulator [Rhizobium leguminosarum]|uniref:helix-turn-helix transcriptional regulator n=1 Tax=Rhizobium ruizarguesonis TaxID=2081791 RepID=UPI0013BDF36B|nr:helix-turn-helix transcriptional regulator [Rhizobium ruizarguesonis]NEI09283.1 helix-turn-helix transcriptional regulator [Rhizobium ruizarguesonis]